MTKGAVKGFRSWLRKVTSGGGEDASRGSADGHDTDITGFHVSRRVYLTSSVGSLASRLCSVQASPVVHHWHYYSLLTD